MSIYDGRHGGPWDRGAADSYYRRPRRPHYYQDKTDLSPRIDEKDMTPDEIRAYHAGFSANEADGDFKQWDFDPPYNNEEEEESEDV